jgi:hypothetical protein
MTQSSQTQTIESLDLTLDKIFNEFYIVPSFQREYVWEDEQVEQLLRDIHDVFSDDGQASEYFIGSLVVCPGDGQVLELIDGQQRMSTSYLFLCAVRDHLADLGADPISALVGKISAAHTDEKGRDVFRYRVDLQYEDSCGVLKRVAEGNFDIDQIPRDTRSVSNIVNAYQTIRTFLNSEFGDDADAVRLFYAYFIHHVKLVRIKTHSVAHALKVFETINDRGVGLDSMDLLKNLMFMRANRDDFERLKDKWKDLVDALYKAREKPLRFLRYYIFATYGVERLREDEIYAWFVKNEKKCGYAANPLAFVDSLRSAAQAYTRFVAGKNADGTPNRYLANIRYLSGAARQHLILLLAGRHLPIENFTELCRQLENLFFAYIITREPTKEFERSFARWALELHQVHSQSDLDAFIANRIYPAKESLAARYELAFQQLRETSIQKYRMRYVLGKMTQYLNELAYGGSEADLSQFVKSQDVEHILPQTPPSNVVAAFDKPDEIHDYIPRLGNMVLLEESINRSIQDEPFVVKKRAYPESRFLLTKTIAEAVQVGVNTKINRAVAGLTPFDEWTSESIERRQEMLTDLAKRVWEME